MPERLASNEEFQLYLDEITQDELKRYPDVQTDGDKLANILNNLGNLLDPTDKIAFKQIAGILGVLENQIPHIYTNGMPDEKSKKRLDRAFVCSTLWLRNFDTSEEMKRNLSFGQPSLNNKSPIEAFLKGNVDKVLYFTKMSLLSQDFI